jgi:Immunity protein 7
MVPNSGSRLADGTGNATRARVGPRCWPSSPTRRTPDGYWSSPASTPGPGRHALCHHRRTGRRRRLGLAPAPGPGRRPKPPHLGRRHRAVILRPLTRRDRPAGGRSPSARAARGAGRPLITYEAKFGNWRIPAIATVRSVRTRPRSCSRRGPRRASAPDSPARSASSRVAADPACDTIPCPPASTSRPFDHAIESTERCLSICGTVNHRRREEGGRLDLFLAIIARKFPGSWGLIYERDDEMPEPPGPNAFRVRVLARGTIAEHLDPFLSPCNPVIEDCLRGLA